METNKPKISAKEKLKIKRKIVSFFLVVKKKKKIISNKKMYLFVTDSENLNNGKKS